MYRQLWVREGLHLKMRYFHILIIGQYGLIQNVEALPAVLCVLLLLKAQASEICIIIASNDEAWQHESRVIERRMPGLQLRACL